MRNEWEWLMTIMLNYGPKNGLHFPYTIKKKGKKERKVNRFHLLENTINKPIFWTLD